MGGNSMKWVAAGMLALFFASAAWSFELSSSDVTQGRRLNLAQAYDGYGCHGGNLSPALRWKDAPAGTRSFALTVFDPDAPTGRGWWHWLIFDIPAAVDALPEGVGVNVPPPGGTRQGRNDFGERAYGGACPPAGDGTHRYVFTLYALKVERLNVDADARPEQVDAAIRGNSLGSARITATYSR
jgi:Raf kinase inhibitor-like YbhB/YbcL family protein